MRYALVSTYPKEGTRNIGDRLIEKATEMAIRAHDPGARVDSIWRAAPWEDVRDTVASADHVVFACLAVRTGMEEVYPYLINILDLGVPVSAISAGTSLRMHSRQIFTHGFSSGDLELLRRFADSATVYSTRGALTQAFCEAHGFAGTELTGDVAFIDPRFDARRFERRDDIRRIVISDPHDGPTYAAAFRRLVEVLRRLFPGAEVHCVQHGTNGPIEREAGKLDVPLRPIFEDPDGGLDAYDDYDLHAGFRVHGHVSALTRRIPSYLLEQDGRGCDYGLTLGGKFSVPCYRTPQAHGTRGQQIMRLLKGQASTRPFVHPSAADILGALVAVHAANGFACFLGYEDTIADFQRRTDAAIARICRAGGA